jgi:AcrR family transcriptional regulator
VERTNQKERTRAALVAAAGELLGEGQSPTVAEAAARARVSRATAYRYFPTQQALLVEAALDLSMPDPEVVVRRGGDDPLARIDAVVRAIHAVVADHEPAFRTMLRSTLEPEVAAVDGALTSRRRGGRRLVYAERALGEALAGAPAELRQRVTTAIAVYLGIETRVVLHDICQLGERRSLEVERWAVRTLVEAALRELAPSPPPRPRPAR